MELCEEVLQVYGKYSIDVSRSHTIASEFGTVKLTRAAARRCWVLWVIVYIGYIGETRREDLGEETK